MLMILATLYLTSQFVKELKNQELAKIQLVKQLSLEEKEEMKIWSDAVSKMASSPVGQEIDPCILDIVKSNNSIPAIWIGSNNEFKDCRNISIPVMGTFEIENNKIKKWRDYFDLETFQKQMTGQS